MNEILSQLSKATLVASALVSTLVVAAPNQTQVTGSSFVNSTQVTRVHIQGKQGSKSGGGGGFSIFGLGAKGSGGSSTDSLKTEANIGQIMVVNATMSGSQIVQKTIVANAHVQGATLNAGQIMIGRQ